MPESKQSEPRARYGESPTSPQASALFHWEIDEFERRPIEKRTGLVIVLVLFAVIGYALYTDSILMAITFILIGMTGYIYSRRQSETLHCQITRTGIIINREFYPFDNIESFWTIEESEHSILSLKTNAIIAPYLHLPIHESDIDTIRVILSEFVPEEEHPRSMVDIIERMLHI